MKFIDAYILAATKRKTRRIRTALVVIVSSLLFAVLFGIALAAQGLIDAGKQFEDVGFNARNLVTVSPSGGGNADYSSKIKTIEDEMIAELRARKVKITDTTKQDPSFYVEFGRRMTKFFAEMAALDQQKTEKQIYELGDPSAVYHFSSLPISQLARYQPDPAVDPLVNELAEQQKAGGSASIYGSKSQEQMEFFSAESEMFSSQIQPGQSFAWKPGEAYPLIVSYNYLEKLAGRSLAKLKAEERNQGYRDLIEAYTGKELTYCYRNTTALDQLNAVMQYNSTVESDKDASTKPVNVPVCEGFDQKQLKKLDIISDEDPTGTKPLFPPAKQPPSDVRHIRFKIVGFTPAAQQYGATDIITQILTSISVLPTGSYPGILPAKVVAEDPLLQSVAAGDGAYSYSTLFADFETRAEQKRFVGQGCAGDECVTSSKPYISAFGNISVALEGVFKFASKFLLIAAGVIMVIAALMIMFTISKVIADSTKEIAVFRSLGARRRDIAQIYYTYGMMLAASGLILSLVLAVIGASVLTALYDDKIAQGLIQATGAYTKDVKVTLIGANVAWLAAITAALFAATALGIAVPVLASIRRKLITILREE